MANTTRFKFELLTNSSAAKYIAINDVFYLLEILLFPVKIIKIDSLPGTILADTIYLISAIAGTTNGSILSGNGGKILVLRNNTNWIFDPGIDTIIGSFTCSGSDWVQNLIRSNATYKVTTNSTINIPNTDGFNLKLLISTGVTITLNFSGTIHGSSSLSTGVKYLSVSDGELYS